MFIKIWLSTILQPNFSLIYSCVTQKINRKLNNYSFWLTTDRWYKRSNDIKQTTLRINYV